MTPVASIIIPAYNHARVLGQAIDSALAQTVPCEVIVVDDGSTDGTRDVIARYREVLTPGPNQREHGGPSKARNAGLDVALGEFVMLLDADDVIAPTKIEEQLAAFTDDVGWILCDVEIQDAARRESVRASVRYRYDDKDLGGWIWPLLKLGNFIPIMAPLVRRSVLEGVRFDDRLVPEDWHFWCAVAQAGRLRYLPRVLATYRKSQTGRSRRPEQSRRTSPNLTLPLRLNLGCGTPTTRSWHPIAGFENLDKSMGWCFEDGLGDFLDHSVAAITISHACMYLPIEHWPFVFSEFARVLSTGGVIRITEDNTSDPESARYGGWKGSEPARTLTDAAMVRAALERAGFTAYDVDRETSHYDDASLCQAQHGAPPDVFFIEGVRQVGVFFAPHSDDEALFGSFTLLRYRPAVVVCFPSAGDYGDPAVREAETRDAMTVLGAGPVEQWPGGDLEAQMRDYDARVHPARVWAPHQDASHPDHVAVAMAARSVFGDRLRTYHTYVNGEKVRRGELVPFEPVWIQQKLRALARYESQIRHPRAHKFFCDDLYEFAEVAL